MNAAVKPGTDRRPTAQLARAGRDQHDREGVVRQDRPAERRRHPYQGGEYHLYHYKKYTDVRLVFAPEKDIAFFGGDPDNFEYPRYDLDICFFRVYEDDKPAKIEHYLKWSKAGAGDGELVFVSGHPGRTNRLNTVAHLEYLRDVQLPQHARSCCAPRGAAARRTATAASRNARRAEDDLFGYQNSRKARIGGLAGLQDPAIMAKKKAEETELRSQGR